MEFKAVGMFAEVANYIMENNKGDILNQLDHIYKYAATHATRISETYDVAKT